MLAAAVAQAVAPEEFAFASHHERMFLRRSFLRYRPEEEESVRVGRIGDQVVLLASSLGHVDLIDTTREVWFVRIYPAS